MLFNIITFFIILIILCLILHYSKDYKEGFFDFPDVNHNTFVQNSQTKFNELTNSINLTDPAIPITPDTANAFKIALGSISTQPISTTYSLGSQVNHQIPNNIPNNFQQAQSCEAAAPSCNAFDDPTFATNCGMSFDKKGISVTGKPHIGGMFISPQDRQKQIDAADVVLSTGGAPYDPYKVYQPTFGKAKPGTFALNKDQCIIVQEKVDCAAKQTFNSSNCTQCYTSQNFARVGPETGRIPSILYLFGSGNVTVSSQNNTIMLPINKLDTTNPMTVAIPADAEGTVFSIIVQQPNNIPMPYIAGYIEGQTPRGTFKLDLFNLVESDQVSKTKPKINGSITVNGFRCFTLVPGTGQTYLNLVCLMPFSFLSMYDGDALTCDNGPIITQAASATFLESDPCFGKDNKPGAYKLECLQTRWIELGGTTQGTGYPSNQIKTDAIQKDANGNPLDIDTIVNNLAPKMTSALTGTDATGTNLSIQNWNTLSMWATGVPINTPCDAPTSQSGPLSQECLQYLYLNQGINSHIGPTYTLAPSSMASMLGQQTANTYCQPGTSIDPSTPAGLKFAQSLGGINSVKQTYDQINRLANDNTQPNDKRSVAINQCYGVNIDKLPTGPAITVPYTKIDGGYLQSANGENISCFSGLSLEQAQQGCNNLGSQCAAFSYATGPNKDGCYKANTTGGMINTSDYVGYVKGAYKLAPPLIAPQGIFTVLAGDAGNNNNNMYYTDTNLVQSDMIWQQIPGGANSIALAPNGSLWQTNTEGAIYFLSNYKNTNWIRIPGSMRNISTDGTYVGGTNSNNGAFLTTYAQAFQGQWTRLSGLFKQISVTNGKLYGIGMDNVAYYSTGNGWIKQNFNGGTFQLCAVDGDIVVFVGMDNLLYYSDTNIWTPTATLATIPGLPGKMKSVSISNGSLYAIDVSSGQPYYTSNYKSSNWTKLPGDNETYSSHRVTKP